MKILVFIILLGFQTEVAYALAVGPINENLDLRCRFLQEYYDEVGNSSGKTKAFV